MTALRLPAVVLFCLLAACAPPRGAAFQDEVLRAADDTEAAPFAVEPVTRDTLPTLNDWPAPGSGARGWLPRVSEPASSMLAVGDSLTLTVWESSDNSLLTAPGQRVVQLQKVQIGPGGRVTLPYIGELRVAGMEPEHARKVIESAYDAVLPSAQVQLVYTPGRQNSVSLVGGVSAPGSYPLPDRDFTVLGLLATGGGVLPSLKHPEIRLMRGGRIYATSIERLYQAPGADTTLRAGDRVIVAEDARSFLSLGAAGTENVHPFPKDQISALEAVALSGGLDANRADPAGVLILRQYPAQAVRQDGKGPSRDRVVFTIDLTTADGLFSAGQFQIEPEDLIYVTESPVTSVRTILQLLGGAIGAARQVSAMAG